MATATYYAGYTLGVTGQKDSLSFNGTALGANPNDVAQGSSSNYGPSVVSSNVATILSGTNTVQSISVPMAGGQTICGRISACWRSRTRWRSASGQQAASGSWSTASNWTGGVPEAVGAGAIIDAPTNSATDDCPRRPVTLGTLLLGNSGARAVGYTLTWQR